MQLSNLSEIQLRDKVCKLARNDRAAIVEIAEHLAEIEQRELPLKWGFPSLWAYCEKELKISDHLAYVRISLARLLKARPTVKELV
jgi:hypothetical protein